MYSSSIWRFCCRCNSWGSSSSTTAYNAAGRLASCDGSNSNTNKTESTLITSSNSSVVGDGQDGGGEICGDFSFLGPQTRHNLGLTLQKQQQQQQAQHHQRLPSRISPTYARTASVSEPRTLVVRPKQRSCSCSSQTDLSIDQSENLSTAVAMATDGFQPTAGRLADKTDFSFVFFCFFFRCSVTGCVFLWVFDVFWPSSLTHPS